MSDSLQRFVSAQEDAYPQALQEIRNGRKASHWMWYIFPQIHGLGYSNLAQYYAIQSRGEAKAYLQHPILGARLREISNVLLELPSDDPIGIFGSTDAMKLRSSMTLFYIVGRDPIFREVLNKFFLGHLDQRTLQILDTESI